VIEKHLTTEVVITEFSNYIVKIIIKKCLFWTWTWTWHL